MKLTILGSNSLIGQHLIKHLQKSCTETQVVSWSLSGSMVDLLGGINTNDLLHFNGLADLESAIKGADMVVNLHEYHDLTMFPRTDLLRKHNVEFVRLVLSIMNDHEQRPTLIHQSSAFVQCSSHWPNINEGETDPLKYRAEWPFPDYCQSKCDAEELIGKENHVAIILRIVPAYGVADQSSIITDVIRISEMFGVIPVIGDRDGLMQMAFVGNIVQAIMSAVDLLWNSTSSETTEDSYGRSNVETVLIADDTAKRDFFTTFKPLLQNGKRAYSYWAIPLIPFYYSYLLMSLILNIFSLICVLPNFIRELPHPSMFYFYFYHWTYFNTLKSRFLLGYRPTLSFEASTEMCKNYYRTLPADRARWSWKPAEIFTRV